MLSFCFRKKEIPYDRKSRIIQYIIFTLLYIGTYVVIHSVTWFVNNFNGLSFAEIVFHLKVPLRGTGSSMLENYYNDLIKKGSIVFFIFIGISIIAYVIRKTNFYCYILRMASIFLLFCFVFQCQTGLKAVGFYVYVKDQLQNSTFIEENYVDTDKTLLIFPEQKRNWIYIYMESMESTYMSLEVGGGKEINLVPELTQLAEENINFSESDMLGGGYVAVNAGWTVGGMVAQTSGLPLNVPIEGNSYGEYSEFLPGVVSLGDILEKEGYNQELMVGSDVSFGGRDLYFIQHGNYKLWDYNTAGALGKIPEDYYVWWGFEDQKLYQFAKEEISSLAAEEKPFNFTMLTVDTHHVGGYVCDLCRNEHEQQYENVISCASRQVADFVEWIQQQNFYENTTIVISGDHLSMDASYFESYDDNRHPRRIYNCIINSSVTAANTKNRDFTTMDLFPTTLAALESRLMETDWDWEQIYFQINKLC